MISTHSSAPDSEQRIMPYVLEYNRSEAQVTRPPLSASRIYHCTPIACGLITVSALIKVPTAADHTPGDVGPEAEGTDARQTGRALPCHDIHHNSADDTGRSFGNQLSYM